MSINKSTRKKLLLAGIITVLVVAFALGLWFFVQYQSNKKTVEVLPVTDPSVSTTYWGDTTYSSGMVTSESLQEIYPSSDKVISQIFVEAGQQVKAGDPLIQYDKTKLELDVEGKDIAVKQAGIELDKAQKELKKLQNTTAATPAPSLPPEVIPTPEPEPTIPPADVPVHSRLDADSKPYQGSGTSEDPYVFLCTEDCVMTREFLLLLLGQAEEEPSQGESSEEEGLISPFAAIFEVRDGDSNYGDLRYSFQLDGSHVEDDTEISQEIPSGENTLESVADAFRSAPTQPENTPTSGDVDGQGGQGNQDNYNDMGYTKEQLDDLIAQQRQKIKDCELKVKQAQLDLEESELALNNSTVCSTIDGVVRTLPDVDTATQSGQPFLVVSGQDQFLIRGSISENYLPDIHVGDSITAMSYENGMTYSATISEISTYPLDSNSGMWYGGGNSNSSNYEFTAIADNAEGLTNGMYLEITLNIPGSASTDALYLYTAYLREDDGGRYVMKAGLDNRLHKQYLQLGTSIYGGQYYEVKDGLTMNDYIAFPYGSDVREGTRVVVQGTTDPPIPEEGSDSSGSLEEDPAADGATDDVATMDGAVYY